MFDYHFDEFLSSIQEIVKEAIKSELAPLRETIERQESRIMDLENKIDNKSKEAKDLSSIMPWSHLCVKPPRMSDVRPQRLFVTWQGKTGNRSTKIANRPKSSSR